MLKYKVQIISDNITPIKNNHIIEAVIFREEPNRYVLINKNNVTIAYSKHHYLVKEA